MKNLFIAMYVLCVGLVVSLGAVYATPIEVSSYWSSGGPYFTADLQYREAGEPYHYSNNSYVSPIVLTLDGKVYDAFCIDLFENINTGTYNNYSVLSVDQYMTGSYATANGRYNDVRNLEYALYNMEKHQSILTGVRENSYAQLNLWNTLYDMYPDGNSGHNNMFFDSNFFATDISRVSNLGFNPYDIDFANFNATRTGVNGVTNNTYNTTVLNALSNDTYVDVKDMYRIIQFSNGVGVQELVVRVGNTPQPNPEPATMILLGFGLIGLAGVSRNKTK